MTISESQRLADREQWNADWGESISPAIEQSGGVLYLFPQPVTRMLVGDAWESPSLPLPAGEPLSEHVRTGVEIQIKGQLASHAGESLLSEVAMLAELETFRSALAAVSSGGSYSLYLYHDESSSYYRRFQDCSTIEFEFDVSVPQLFSYSVKIYAEDPVLYATAPGV